MQHRIAVLIPVYNNWRGLQESLRSLRRQSAGCDAIIVDDGSTPPISEDACKAEYPQSRVIRQFPNAGIIAALNNGIRAVLADGYEYLARLDAGDRCEPERLEVQARFLDDHRSLMLVGSDISFIDLAGNFLRVIQFPRDLPSIRRTMPIRSSFSHPAVMMRTSVFSKVGMYRPEDICAEDYGFFFRVSKAFPAANLPKVLTVLELDPNSISLSRRGQQLRTRLRIQLEHFDYRLPESYLGVLKSLALIVTPMSVAAKAKVVLFGRVHRVSSERRLEDHSRA
jgi:glycosyltransferase involved in cell wall biosynthesis